MNKGRDSRDTRWASFGLQYGAGRTVSVIGVLLLLLAAAVAGCGVVEDLSTTTTSSPATTTTQRTTTTTQQETTTTGQATTTTEVGQTTTTLPGGFSAGSTTTTLPTASNPFGPQHAEGTVLYEIDDWSEGVSGWAAAGQWHTLDGMLVTDGGSDSYAVAPVDLTDYPDYAVECEVQIVDPSTGTAVLLLARLINGTAYYGGFDSAGSNMVVGLNTQELASVGFVLDSEWHTFRLEVRGDSIKLFLEQAEVARAVDERIQEAGTAGIYCGKGQINVRAFRVVTL